MSVLIVLTNECCFYSACRVDVTTGYRQRYYSLKFSLMFEQIDYQCFVCCYMR
ncbi:hypothetical protein XF_0194 [Xylella fastidiosa 9a5c]|uniref:Uncharacterized protein n=1 Tax=Xylella fastidiosa (strain 9a5c) TaxID=160492 RepID=Q9PGV4_XYLFA|nr:hypothetical protein XF_0194 [Xylella fastidiosa 9a5c]